jgi:hypothetical protein
MEAIWSEISLDVALSLEISLKVLANQMTVQVCDRWMDGC